MAYPQVDVVGCDFDKDGVVGADDVNEIEAIYEASGYGRKYDSDFNDVVAADDVEEVSDRYLAGQNIATIRNAIKKDIAVRITWPDGWSANLVGVDENHIKEFTGADMSYGGDMGWITVHDHPYQTDGIYEEYVCRHFAEDTAIAAYKALGYGVLLYAQGIGHAYNMFWTGEGGDDGWRDLHNWRLLEPQSGRFVSSSFWTGIYKTTRIGFYKGFDSPCIRGYALVVDTETWTVSPHPYVGGGFDHCEYFTNMLEEVPIPSTFDVTLGVPSIPPAAPTNVSATDGDYTDGVVVTWTRASGATQYQVYRDGVGLGWLGDVNTYNDKDADAPFIIAGSAVASDGDYAAYVRLSLSGQSVHNGTTHTYKVRAKNAMGESPDSDTDTGYRGHGELAYQWQRSSGDADSGYSNIDGANTAIYNDTGAPADGSGRYYKCIEYAEGAESATSTADRGYRAFGGHYTRSATVSLGLKATGSFLQGGYQTEILRPNAAGDETNLIIGGSSPAVTNWESVDETVSDDDITYVYNNTTAYVRDLYNLSAPSGSGTISFVKVYARCRLNAASAAWNLKIAIKTGGTAYEGSQTVMTTSYALYSHQWNTNPGGGNWTWEQIAALQAGVALKHSSSGYQGRCTQIYVEVEYTTEPQHYTRSYTALLGLLSVASKVNVLARSETALLGLKAIASRVSSHWVSPTSHNDPDNKWDYETRAYDDDEVTHANNTTANHGYYLELAHSALPCNKIRVLAQHFTGVGYEESDLNVDVYYTDAWHNVWSGTVPKLTWQEMPLGVTKSVTAVRIKNNKATGSGTYLYEVDFWEKTSGVHFERLYIALLGLKATATRAWSLGRVKTVLLGLKPTGIRTVTGNIVREGVVYLGLKATATRTVVLTYIDTALLGLKAIASREVAYTRAGVALLGLKAIAVRILAESVRKIPLTVKFFSRAITILARTRRER